MVLDILAHAFTRTHRYCSVATACMVLLLSVFPAGTVRAQALLVPGDSGLRSDVQLLTDAGVIDLPLMTWPIPLADLQRAVGEADLHRLDASPALAASWARLQATAANATSHWLGGWRMEGAKFPERLRTFEDTPRTSAGATAWGDYSGEAFVAHVSLGVVAAPQDKQALRADGSYLSFKAGNWIVGVAAMDRWWGPGWDGSLILSNAARPIPAVILERRTSQPFKSPWLHWLGAWRVSALVGQLEQNRSGVESPQYFAARVAFKPRRWWEIAISRSIILCGSGRRCGITAWTEALLERQNPGGGYGTSQRFERAQLAGFDTRINSPWPKIPVALYGQMVGEDAEGGIPFKYLGLFGAEAWMSPEEGWMLRGHLEFADTACSFSRNPRIYGCAYHDQLYAPGIQYRGFPIGDSLDADSQVYSFGMLATSPGSTRWGMLVRSGLLNRAGENPQYNTLTPVAQRLRSLQGTWQTTISRETFSVLAGYEQRTPVHVGPSSSGPQLSLRWTHEL